jgi:hypothetical protein
MFLSEITFYISNLRSLIYMCVEYKTELQSNSLPLVRKSSDFALH